MSSVTTGSPEVVVSSVSVVVLLSLGAVEVAADELAVEVVLVGPVVVVVVVVALLEATLVVTAELFADVFDELLGLVELAALDVCEELVPSTALGSLVELREGSGEGSFFSELPQAVSTNSGPLRATAAAIAGPRLESVHKAEGTRVVCFTQEWFLKVIDLRFGKDVASIPMPSEDHFIFGATYSLVGDLNTSSKMLL